MRHAWDAYEKYAFGANELRPLSKRPNEASVFGGGNTGFKILPYFKYTVICLDSI